MQLIRGLHNLNDNHRGTVLTIGNFDGVHLGHQHILKRLVACAAEHGMTSTVMIFEPHPEELFNKDTPPARLTRLREKLVNFKRCHVDRVLLVKFNKSFSSMTAEHFVNELLIKKLAVKHLIIGDDFRFGYKRKGDYQLLKALSEEHQFVLENTDTLMHNDQRISSTAIRNAIAKGDLDLAKQMLGRSFSISGRIFHGDKRGRSIGFPTANIHLHRKRSPVSGVYAVQLLIGDLDEQKTVVNGIANIGNRPTINGKR